MVTAVFPLDAGSERAQNLSASSEGTSKTAALLSALSVKRRSCKSLSSIRWRKKFQTYVGVLICTSPAVNNSVV